MASHVHCRVVSPRGTQPQDELFPYIADGHPNIQSALSQSQPSQRLSHAVPESALPAPLSRRGSSVPNQLARLLRRGSSVPNQLAKRTVDDDVWPCDNHECPIVDGHTSRLFLHPVVSDQSVLSPGPGTCSHAPPA
jgi:hypothetical protein